MRLTTLLMLFLVALDADAQKIDLSNASIVVRPGDLPLAEQAAGVVLQEEIEKRSGIRLPISGSWPDQGSGIAISSTENVPAWNKELPAFTERNAEGYRLYADADDNIWILGADARGTLYGVGDLLRNLEWGKGVVSLSAPIDRHTAPAYPIRGHQLGFRHRANSWDAWTPEQFDQYMRELAFFGVNSIENIPFEDEREGPLMKVTRREMNQKLSEICARYGMDYWVWTPADYDLTDTDARAAALDKHEQLYQDCEELTGVFFPGGDPGHNPPELVLPFLEDISKRLSQYHPDARVWLSLQWFNKKQIAYIYDFLETESPDWLGGLVAGPSSPRIPETRRRLPAKYKYRLYPDITHNKICQYPVPWWDQAYALTLGREAINPRPAQYTQIHNWFAPHSDGFISYSDGVHDDVNKSIWSALGWDPSRKPRETLVEYCRVFFGPDVAEAAADGILALENNWRGSLIDNGAVESTLLLWQKLEEAHPELDDNWRWQMNQVRAVFDAYLRHRLIHETRLEQEVNAILRRTELFGSQASMQAALDKLNEVKTQPESVDLRDRIFELCEKLFQSIQLQTSVPKYQASGAERGAFLDFVDYPMNNRWWLEDQFAKIAEMNTEAEKNARLLVIANWENPGLGSYYDDIGNTAKSNHVWHSDVVVTQPGEEVNPEPTLWWWDNGMSRERLSFQSSMGWPKAVVYEGLDTNANYIIRTTGYGQALLKMDGQPASPSINGTGIGEFKDFPVPTELIQDRELIITWDRPTNEGHLNWRQHSRVSEIWLLKH
ncbi:MAG: glycoside hydrolase family 20 zincin-like fold domain-containing protein [Candidatus Hydrogenedentota bacterium]